MAYEGEIQANTFEIRSANDLDNLASGGVITIATTTQLIFNTTAGITTSNRFDVTAGELRINTVGGPVDITYIGGGTFYTVSGTAGLDTNEININGAATGTLFASTTRGQIEIDNGNFIAWAGLGSVVGATVFALRNVQNIIFDTGLTLDVANLLLDVAPGIHFGVPSTAMYLLTSQADAPAFSINQVGTIGAPADVLRIDPAIPDATRLTVSGGVASGDFFDTSGATGTFTAVADASIGSTSITSVTDNSGVARFNFTGPTVFVDQEVTLTGFASEPSYNETGIITATDGTSFFEYRNQYNQLLFAGDDSGSFTSVSITLTDTSTTLVDGDRVKIDTDAATDYDSSGVVYNQLTNTFQLNKLFTVTKTGTWSTEGLNQDDIRVLAFDNAGEEDSHYILAAFVNNNATANGAIVNNTFTDMVFGTGGSALVEGSTIERFKLIDELNATFEYTGAERFDGSISFDFSSVSSGGTVDFRYKWLIDTGSGFVDLPDAVEALSAIGSNAVSVTKTFPLRMSKGDQIKPQITRNSGSSGIITQYATIYATQ